MKKLTPIFILCLCMFFASPVHAASDIPSVSNSVSNSILFETKTLEFTPFISPLMDAEYIYVTEEVTFNGLVTPGDSIDWSKTYGGVVYVGTLYLSSYYHTIEKNTIAIYKGTLYPE